MLNIIESKMVLQHGQLIQFKIGSMLVQMVMPSSGLIYAQQSIKTFLMSLFRVYWMILKSDDPQGQPQYKRKADAMDRSQDGNLAACSPRQNS
jgi:hypothetical protein